MVELKTHVIQQTIEESYLEVSDSEFEFLLSLLKIGQPQYWSQYSIKGTDKVHVSINNICLPPVVRKVLIKMW